MKLASIHDGPMRRGDAEKLAAVFKALADPQRLFMLSVIADRGRSCGKDLIPLTGLTRPTVAHHLLVLARAGLVRSEKEAPFLWYRLAPGVLDAVAAAIGGRS